MPSRVAILCGPARCGKTERLLRRYRRSLAEQPPGASLWLAPTWRAAAAVQDRLLDAVLPGCFAPGVMTFGKFAQSVLRAAAVPIRPVTRWMKRELIRRTLDGQLSAGRLRHFRGIAKTAGLVDMVCEFIGELKRLEIWPEDFRCACETRGLGDRDVELLEVYDLYQQTLREHGLFDAEGAFWSARDELQKNARPENAGAIAAGLPFAPRLVVVDGFTDFTRTQHEILQILAQRADELLVSLPLEPEPRRTDLFAKPRKTLDQLKRRHPAAAVEELARPGDAAWPAMSHLERAIFRNPRAKASGDAPSSIPHPSPLGLEILAAASELGEVEMIGSRIKRLLVDGEARPGDIVVVFRSLDAAADLAREVFGQLGIPAAIELGRPLDRSPAMRALVALLRLDLDDWPFERLLAVLGSSYFRLAGGPSSDGRAALIERTIRRLQIPHGRGRLLEQLKRATADEYVLAVVERLAAAFDALPVRATLPEWGEAWRRLAETTGLSGAMEGSDEDRRAWNRLLDILGEDDTLAAWRHERPAEVDRRAAFETMVDIVAGDRIGHAGDESGQVRVLSAASVRSLRADHVFLAGLSEKAFPPPEREDRLYNEAECLRLIEAGLPLVGRTERTREEMLLFYEVATRATKRLYLSFPSLDASAQPLLPSPLLVEVEQAFAPQRIPREERTDLSPVPLSDEPLCDADFRVKAVATALDGNVALLAGLMQTTPKFEFPVALNLAAGLESIASRQDRAGFGPAEGVLQGANVHDYLNARYPAGHVFAATDLERYASCPFRFFLERVLAVEPVEDLALECDARHRGRVVHDILATFHRRANERLGRSASSVELDEAEFRAMLDAAIRDSLPPEPDNPIQAALREVDRRLVVEWLAEYRRQVEAYADLWKDFDAPMAAALFEVSFGRGDEPPPSVERPLEFVRRGKTFRVSGRIDRVDVGQVAGHEVFNVLDYKTGGPIPLSIEAMEAGTTLQPPLYALGAMELLFADRDAIPWRAGYWYVRDDGFKPRQALAMYRNDDGRIELEPAWERLRDELGGIVARLVESIRGGWFPVCSADDNCTGYCPFSTICRINHVRSLEKTWQPRAET